MKTTRKQIRLLVLYHKAVNVNNWSQDLLEELKEEEGGLIEIAWSSGTNGRNGGVWQGRKTGELYAVTDRLPALFCLM